MTLTRPRIVLAIVVVNWLVFGGFSAWIGGNAIGTTPSSQGFVVVSHGQLTPAARAVWLFSLVYSLGTLTLTPAIVVVQVLQMSASGKLRGFRVAIAIFFALWAVGWYWTLIRDGGLSIRDYASMSDR